MVSGLIARTAIEEANRPIEANRSREAKTIAERKPFWESRPFTRIIRGWAAFRRLSHYIKKNQLEAHGYTTARAKEIVRMIAGYEFYLEQTAAIDLSHPPT